jgi:hypothetical protein
MTNKKAFFKAQKHHLFRWRVFISFDPVVMLSHPPVEPSKIKASNATLSCLI